MPEPFNVQFLLHSGSLNYTTVDITNRVIRVGQINERLSDRDRFVVPTFDFEVDNSDNWIETYKADIFHTYVTAELIVNNVTIFIGLVENVLPADDLADKKLKFRASHTIDNMKRKIFSKEGFFPKIGAKKQKVKHFFAAYWGIKQRIVTDITASSVYWDASNLDEIYVDWDYLANDRDGLEVLGDFLRTFGSLYLWQNNTVTLKDRDSVLFANPTTFDSDIIKIKKYDFWEQFADGAKITSGDYTRKTQGVRLSNVIDINVDILNYLYVYQSGLGYVQITKAVGSQVLGAYERFYGDSGAKIIQTFDGPEVLLGIENKRDRSKMLATFEGVNHWVGTVGTIQNKRYIINETTKNVAKRFTDVELISVF